MPTHPPATIDLNCDLGEGGPSDAELMPLVTSANVCCGAHAGGDDDSLAALRLAVAHGVQSRRAPRLSPIASTSAAASWTCAPSRSRPRSSPRCVTSSSWPASEVGATVRVHQAARGALQPGRVATNASPRPSSPSASGLGCRSWGCPARRCSAAAGRVPFIAEGFADRRYRARRLARAARRAPTLSSIPPDEAVEQAKRLLAAGRVRTLCVHGDNPEAVAFVRGPARGAARARASPCGRSTCHERDAHASCGPACGRWSSMRAGRARGARRARRRGGGPLRAAPSATPSSATRPTPPPWRSPWRGRRSSRLRRWRASSTAAPFERPHGRPAGRPPGRRSRSRRARSCPIGGTPCGVRAYLCVRGGIDAPAVLGSRSSLAPLAAGMTLACHSGRIAGRSLGGGDIR